jgi:hypothetical protein
LTFIVYDRHPLGNSQTVLASALLLRVSIVGELFGAIVLIFVVRQLYGLLYRVDAGQAALMVTFVLVSVPIAFVNALNAIAALTLARDAAFSATMGQSHSNALAMLFLTLHGDGVGLANIFWGLWLVPFGILVLKSSALPRILGALLIINGGALVAVSLTLLLLPAQLDLVNRIAILPELGELWVMAWLLVKGARPGRARSAPSLPGMRS